ncbi:MAG: thiamine/thiamine pyrophosphate ABC transporter permease ThiP [Paracoccaceae bacterium]
MAARSQQIDRLPVLGGAAVAAFLLALSGGTLAIVALRAGEGAVLGAADWAAIRFTVSQALVSAFLSTLLAVPVARALARRRFFGRRLLVLLLGAPFILPVIVAVLGLLAIYGRAGLLSGLIAPLDLGPLDIYGFRGVVLAHVFFNLPLVTRLLLQGWSAIPAEQFRLAAGLDMSSRDVFRTLERPMLRRVLPGAFATVFLLCVASFAVVLALGGGPGATTVELAIYQAFRFDFDLARAATLALVQFALCAVAAYFAWRFRYLQPTGTGQDRRVERWDARGMSARLGDGLVIGLVSAFLLLPLGAIVLRGAVAVVDLPASVLLAAFRSLGVAFASAVLAPGAALVLAIAVVRLETSRSRRAGLLEASGYLSIAASPMVIGTGLFVLVFPHFEPARLALPLTALVNAAMSLPFALRALLPAVRDVDQNYGQLAASLGMQRGAWFLHVLWPRIRPVAGFAAGLAAALSMGDLGVIALFADPQSATLPLALYRLMAAYRMDAASGAALLLVALSLALFWVFDRLGGQHVRAG